MYGNKNILHPFVESQNFLERVNPEQSTLVSSNPEDRLITALNTLGWQHYFSAVVGYTTEGVNKRKKTDPVSYLIAAEKIGIAVERCWIPEDSLPGVMSGVRTGAHQVLLVDRENALHKDEELQSYVAEKSDRVTVIPHLNAIEFAA